MEVVLRTRTPDGVEVILSALVYAKILEEHPAVADLDLIAIEPFVSPMSAGPIRGPVESGSSAARVTCGCLPWWTSKAFLPSS